MAGVAMQMLILMLLTFKKVKLIFGHPVHGVFNFFVHTLYYILIHKICCVY